MSVTEKIDFSLLREQRDCCLEILDKLQCVKACRIPPDEYPLSFDQAMALTGIVELLDNLLDEEEGFLQK